MIGVLSSRHRNKYFLRLSRINNDLLRVNGAGYDFEATGDFYFEITLKVPASPGAVRGVFGRSKTLGSQRCFLQAEANGDLRLRYSSDATFGKIDLPSFFQTYEGQIVTVRASFEGDQRRMYVDGLLLVDVMETVRPAASSEDVYVNTISGDSSYAMNFDCYGFNLNGEQWNLVEGKGFDTISNLGNIALGETSNAGGLTYWNNNVGKK